MIICWRRGGEGVLRLEGFRLRLLWTRATEGLMSIRADGLYGRNAVSMRGRQGQYVRWWSVRLTRTWVRFVSAAIRTPTKLPTAPSFIGVEDHSRGGAHHATTPQASPEKDRPSLTDIYRARLQEQRMRRAGIPSGRYPHWKPGRGNARGNMVSPSSGGMGVERVGATAGSSLTQGISRAQATPTRRHRRRAEIQVTGTSLTPETLLTKPPPSTTHSFTHGGRLLISDPRLTPRWTAQAPSPPRNPKYLRRRSSWARRHPSDTHSISELPSPLDIHPLI